jgi:hypothetical protein
MSLTSSSFNYQISPMSAPKKIAIKDNGEVILLKEGHVEITDLSAVIGQRTYTIANIHSVHVHAYRTKLFLSMFFVLVVAAWSVSVAMLRMDTYTQSLVVDLVIGIAGLIFLIVTTKTKYSIRIRSSGGELNIFESNDKNFVGRIAHAINRAIFLREFN